ncbi:hypothetical protein ACJX0J_021023, partial [Zea mays]
MIFIAMFQTHPGIKLPFGFILLQLDLYSWTGIIMMNSDYKAAQILETCVFLSITFAFPYICLSLVVWNSDYKAAQLFIIILLKGSTNSCAIDDTDDADFPFAVDDLVN